MTLKDEIRELSTCINVMEAEVLAQDLRTVVTRLEMLADLIESREKVREKRFNEQMIRIDERERDLDAKIAFVSRLIGLIGVPGTEEMKCQKSEGSSSLSHMLKEFAKNTR